MNRTIHINRNFINFGIPLALLGTLILLVKSPFFNGNDILSFAITADLLLIVPLVYFLLIRKSEIPNTTVIPVMIIGLLVGSYFLPQQSQTYLSIFKTWILPFLELIVLSYVLYKVRKAVLKFKENKTSTFDFFTTLKKTCYEILPKNAVMLVVTEIAVFYYGFINWKRREIKVNEFTYHKDSGIIALLIVTIFIVAIETAVLHILLSKWSNILAWILTFLSIYSGIQILGFLKSLTKRPYKIENGKVFLSYGILSETIINLDDIETIEISSKDIEFDKETRKLSPLGSLESHNVVITLKNKSVLNGFYGLKRDFKTLAFFVDKKVKFKQSIETAILDPDSFNFVSSISGVKQKQKSSLTDKQKSLKYIGLVILLSWLFGFISFNIFNPKNDLFFGISTLIFSLLPALIGYILNKTQGGNWKDLGFVKPILKNTIPAFLAPFLYFGVVIIIQYALDIRTSPNWQKFGTINELILSMILGYPLMMILLLGEEIGWRGYLQNKLVNSFGGLNGVLILGFIWGIWHLPISLQGHNLPENPLLEAFITTPLMCIALSLIIAYIGLNSKSIFIGLLLHTTNNHFGGTFLQLTETKDEFLHAMTFCSVYIPIIIVMCILIKKRKTPYNI